MISIAKRREADSPACRWLSFSSHSRFHFTIAVIIPCSLPCVVRYCLFIAAVLPTSAPRSCFRLGPKAFLCIASRNGLCTTVEPSRHRHILNTGNRLVWAPHEREIFTAHHQGFDANQPDSTNGLCTPPAVRSAPSRHHHRCTVNMRNPSRSAKAGGSPFVQEQEYGSSKSCRHALEESDTGLILRVFR